MSPSLWELRESNGGGGWLSSAPALKLSLGPFNRPSRAHLIEIKTLWHWDQMKGRRRGEGVEAQAAGRTKAGPRGSGRRSGAGAGAQARACRTVEKILFVTDVTAISRTRPWLPIDTSSLSWGRRRPALSKPAATTGGFVFRPRFFQICCGGLKAIVCCKGYLI